MSQSEVVQMSQCELPEAVATTSDEMSYFQHDVEIDEYSELREELNTFLQEASRSFAIKSELARRNQSAELHRPNDVEISKRDSSVKKNTSFIKKLRNFSYLQIDLIKECHTLNLSKYLSEAVKAIAEARKKFIDIPYSVQLCTELNCIYAEFAHFLQEEYIKVLTINKDEPVSNSNKLRVELCFYAELSLCAVIPQRQSLPVLGTALTALTADNTFNTLNLILSFCKHCGPDFAGLVPRRIRLLCDQFNEPLPESNLLSKVKQSSVKNLLSDYYKSLCKHLHKEQEQLLEYEKQNRQILAAKGEIRPGRVTNVEIMKTEIQNLLRGVITFSEILDAELPDLPDSDFEELTLSDSEDCIGGLVWEDEETRQFYTELPDVKEFLAPINNNQDEENTKATPKTSEKLCYEDGECKNKKGALDNFLSLLPDCCNKAAIDNAALEYLLFYNSKNGCKKLITTLYTIMKNRLELLPFYARFVAICNPVVPEIGTTLCQQLKSEMLRHIHKKNQVNMDFKRKTVKYIGELVKFDIYGKKECLWLLKMLLLDFTHHNIEMTCILLDSCGSVLIAASDTHISVKYYLEQMMRLKTMMALDARYVNMIESSYYQILPPETSSLPAAVQLTTMQQFISHLIYQDLQLMKSEKKVLGLLRSLHWDDRECFRYIVNCLTNADKISFPYIKNLASVVSMLAEYQEDAVCQVVDGVLEDVRLGMEVNTSEFNQRRVAMVKYLGELYNYRLLDTSEIIKVLYSLISFGVGSEDNWLVIDPPQSVIRLHLILLLLTTCALPLNLIDIADKLDYFLIHFQYYFWTKRSSPVWTDEQPFPTDIVYRFEDTLESLNPDLKLANNLEEATHTMTNLNNKLFSEYLKVNENQSLSSTVTWEEDEPTEEDEGGNILEDNAKLKNQEEDGADSEFLHELSQMVSDSIKEREVNKTKPNTDISVPFNYKKILEDDKPQFVILLKKGNKQTCKTLNLPPDDEFIVGLKSRQQASNEEKEKFKKLTLDINERLQDI